MTGPQPGLPYTWVEYPMGSTPRPVYYPAMLDLAGRDALLVGGGEVAAQKAGPLIEAGARLPVLPPALPPPPRAPIEAGGAAGDPPRGPPRDPPGAPRRGRPPPPPPRPNPR